MLKPQCFETGKQKETKTNEEKENVL